MMPTPLIVISAIFAFFALLLLLRVRLTVTLRDDVVLTLSVLFVRIRLFPRKEKKVRWRNYSPKRSKKLAERKAKKAARKAAKKAKKQAKKHSDAEQKKKKPTTLTEKLILVRALCATILRKTGKHLRLRAARLHIRVATGDAATTAILYGAVSGVLASLLALLDRATVLRARSPQVAVIADYLSEKPSADVKLVFSLRIFGILSILVSTALTYLFTKTAHKKEKINAI